MSLVFHVLLASPQAPKQQSQPNKDQTMSPKPPKQWSQTLFFMSCYLSGIPFPSSGLCNQQSSAELRCHVLLVIDTLLPGSLWPSWGEPSLPKSTFSSTFVKKNGSTERLQTPVFLHHVLPQCSDHSALSSFCVSSTEQRHAPCLCWELLPLSLKNWEWLLSLAFPQSITRESNKRVILRN